MLNLNYNLLGKQSANQLKCIVSSNSAIKAKFLTIDATAAVSDANRTTVIPGEVDKFRKYDYYNWKMVDGPFKLYHGLNRLRFPLVRYGLLRSGIIQNLSNDAETANNEMIKDLDILDVGCGGGIFAARLAKQNANVVGIDPAEEAIEVANQWCRKYKWYEERARFEVSTIEEHAKDIKNKEKYHAVVASEVLHFVNDIEFFLDQCFHVLQPGGSLFLTTINKTWQSKMTVKAFEMIPTFLPYGLHDLEKFIDYKDLEAYFNKHGYHIPVQLGLYYFPISNFWRFGNGHECNYCMQVIKTPRPQDKHIKIWSDTSLRIFSPAYNQKTNPLRFPDTEPPQMSDRWT